MTQINKIYTVIADEKSLQYPEIKAGILPEIISGAKRCFKNFLFIKTIEIDETGDLTALVECEKVGECRMTLPKSLLITIGADICDSLKEKIVNVYVDKSYIFIEKKNEVEINGKILPLRF